MSSSWSCATEWAVVHCQCQQTPMSTSQHTAAASHTRTAYLLLITILGVHTTGFPPDCRSSVKPSPRRQHSIHIPFLVPVIDCVAGPVWILAVAYQRQINMQTQLTQVDRIHSPSRVHDSDRGVGCGLGDNPVVPPAAADHEVLHRGHGPVHTVRGRDQPVFRGNAAKR